LVNAYKKSRSINYEEWVKDKSKIHKPVFERSVEVRQTWLMLPPYLPPEFLDWNIPKVCSDAPRVATKDAS